MLSYLRALRQAHRALGIKDLPSWQREILAQVRPFTMAGELRTLATIGAVEYLVAHDIEGDIVECGVWRGGQMMAVALTLKHFGAQRDIHLFDTFTGMTRPDVQDSDHRGAAAAAVYETLKQRPVGARWCEAGIQDVQQNLSATGYAKDRIHFIQGDVEKTIPEHSPNSIAYLRLDTDWYASTAHEFLHLYPRVVQRGVVAVDDYGHWQGARQATDEYLRAHGIVALLHRIDYSARQFVKV